MLTINRYYLLGRPHFGEGFVGVREWDYLFHFHTPGRGSNGVTTCQFKVLYDSNYYTNEFYWKSVDPVDATCPPDVKQQAERFTIDADALFDFDSANLRPEGQRKLQGFAEGLSRMGQFSFIEVAGYTDRLGSDTYNLRLSQDRANCVRNYLINLGVPANKVTAQGYGKSNPVVQCDGSGRELISCLQPNRRVEIELK
ncbi:Outer membrane protein A [Oligella sp. MSHR50489EDL]|uniref:OmpA family protein n=1 Tax=Oligella sp. MSHR50489EDL TaxID=3139409 RepID=UPI003D812CDE